MKNIESYINEIKLLIVMLGYGDIRNRTYEDERGFLFFHVSVDKNYETPVFTFKYSNDNFIYLHVKLYDKDEKHWNQKYVQFYEENVIETIYKFFSLDDNNAKTI